MLVLACLRLNQTLAAQETDTRQISYSVARVAMIIEIWFKEDNHETRIIKREELKKYQVESDYSF